MDSSISHNPIFFLNHPHPVVIFDVTNYIIISLNKAAQVLLSQPENPENLSFYDLITEEAASRLKAVNKSFDFSQMRFGPVDHNIFPHAKSRYLGFGFPFGEEQPTWRVFQLIELPSEQNESLITIFRSSIDTMITKVSKDMVQATQENYEGVLEQGLANIAENFHADSVALFSCDEREAIKLAEFSKPDVDYISPSEIAISSRPWLFKKITQQKEASILLHRKDLEGVSSNEFSELLHHGFSTYAAIVGSRERGVSGYLRILWKEKPLVSTDHLDLLHVLVYVMIESLKRVQYIRQLTSSQNLIQQVSDSFPGILYILDLQNRSIIYINKEVENILGYAANEIVEMKDKVLNTILAPEDLYNFQSRDVSKYRDAKDGEVVEWNYKALHKDGSIRWLHNRDVVISRGSHGEPVQIVGTAIDITDQKERIKEVTTKSLALEQVRDAVIITNTDGFLTYANKAAEKIYGKDVSKFLGKKLTDLEGVQIMGGQDWQTIKTELIINGHWRGEQIIEHPSGPRFTEAISNIMTDSTGEIMGFLTVVRDATRRKQFEIELQKSEAQYRAIVEDQTELICHYTRDNRITFANQAYCRFFGAEEIKLLQNGYLDHIHPGDIELMFSNSDQISVNDPVKEYVVRCFNGDGQLRWVQWTDRGIFDAQNKIIHYQSVGMDITEKKIAEESLKKALHQQEVLHKELHHRVKNNMQIVSSLLGIQMENLNDDRAKEALKEAQERILTMALIHEQLYSSEIFGEINAADYVQTLIERFDSTYLNFGDNIKIELDLEHIMLPLETAIPCGLILNEMLSNSAKYAFDKSIAKPIIFVGFRKKNDFLELTYYDNGVGLLPDFDFVNTSSLGMFLIQTLVLQLNGNVQVSSNPGLSYCIRFGEEE